MATSRPYRHQPRIGGVTRQQRPSGLLPVVEAGLQAIARMEKRSVSWVVAEIVCAYFGLDSATGKVITPAEQHERTTGPRIKPPVRTPSVASVKATVAPFVADRQQQQASEAR